MYDRLVKQQELMELYDRLAVDAAELGWTHLKTAACALREVIESFGPSPEYDEWAKRAAAIGLGMPAGPVG